MKASILFVCLASAASAMNVPSSKCFQDESLRITQEFLSDPVPEETKVIVNRGERDFSVNLIKSLFKDFNETGITSNIFVSPSSIFQTLVLAYFGAQGDTADELAQVLGFEGQLNRSDVVKNYMFEQAFQAIRERNPDLGYQLTHANKLYFDRALPLNECLQLILTDSVEAVDFQANAEKARGLINEWVETKTNKKIKNLLVPGSIDGATKVALVNAAYFKGQWNSQFKTEDTKLENFYVKRNEITMTKFMHQKGKFNYYTSEELRAHVLEMPYIGEDVSMMIVLPPFEDDSLAETVRRLTPETLQAVIAEVKSGFYQVDELTVQIPRFKIEQTFELSSNLGALGVNSLFDAANGDLSGFLNLEKAGESDRVSLQKATHKSFIEVNEEGSEAAAATVLFGFRSARPLFHTEFIANHPFLFLIYDKKTDLILFFGVYQSPKM